jgi:hypothetical protein
LIRSMRGGGAACVKRPPLRRIACSLFAVFALLAAACEGPADPANQDPGTYTISGTITKSNGGGAAGAAVQLKQGGSDIGSPVTVGANGAYAITGVSAGTYTIEVSLSGYANGTINVTVSNANLSGKDLTLAAFLNTVSAVSAYLASASGGAAPSNAVPLAADLNLADTGENGWAALLSAIGNAKKYVSLDLSACAMSGTTFDPGTANKGETYIASLVLPDTAKNVVAAGLVNTPFQYFTNLKSIRGTGITSIGSSAFLKCTALETADFPLATSIGDGAFSGCTALKTVNIPLAASIGYSAFATCGVLKTVNLPAVTSIGDGAFINCIALETADFPLATFIGNDAFRECTALKTVNLPLAASIGVLAFAHCGALKTVTLPAATSISSQAFFHCEALEMADFPKATSIGDNAFDSCEALKTVTLPAVISIDKYVFAYTGTQDLEITLGSTAPSVGTITFDGVTSTKSVTVKVPQGAAGYGTVPGAYSGTDAAKNWGNGFRGAGWTGKTFVFDDSFYINSNITLTIKYDTNG